MPVANPESQIAPKLQDFCNGKWLHYVKAMSHTKNRPQSLVMTKKAAWGWGWEGMMRGERATESAQGGKARELDKAV